MGSQITQRHQLGLNMAMLPSQGQLSHKLQSQGILVINNGENAYQTSAAGFQRKQSLSSRSEVKRRRASDILSHT